MIPKSVEELKKYCRSNELKRLNCRMCQGKNDELWKICKHYQDNKKQSYLIFGELFIEIRKEKLKKLLK